MVYKDCWDLLDRLERRVQWAIMVPEESLVVQDCGAIQELMEMLAPLA